MVMGTEEGKTEPEKDKGNASACFLWELTACQGFFDLCCRGGRTPCLALPKTQNILKHLLCNQRTPVVLLENQQRFYLDIITYALCFAHQKKCAIIYQREIGVKKSGAHHCKAIGNWGFLRREHAERVKQQTACVSVAKNLTSTSKW